MIKINELRIGNLLKLTTPYGKKDQIVGIEGITYGYLRFADSTTDGEFTREVPFKYFEPIPLTVDCIKKFEFFEEYSSSKGKGCFQKKFINITIADNGFYCYCGDCRRHISITLHHVHQLQNLYFALTGEELTMK